MSKPAVDRTKLEKLAEDLWDRMRRCSQFDVVCDPSLNLEYDDDRQTFVRLLVAEAAETFKVRND